MISVTFHALLPTHLWKGYDQSSSTVYMRFGHDELGDWKYNHGPIAVEPKYVHVLTIIYSLMV